MIEINNLSKSFGTKEVLRNINLALEKGNVYGIVGENGSGKTTLFRCIAGLEKYSGIVNSSYAILKNHLGFLQTEPYFFSKITGREYLQLISIARNNKVADFRNRNIFELPLDQYAVNYSSGMKKKLALTAILIQENDIIILDEPFNGVDIHSNIIITGIIHKLKELGKTVIISSHIFSTLAETCDEIHLLREGVLIKKVFKDHFNELEQEMKEFIIGNKIEKLELK